MLPDAFGRFPSINVPPLELPRGLGSGGILGGIPQMLADRAAANDPWTAARNSIVGAFADPPSTAAASSTFGQGGILGALAGLQPSAPSPPVASGFTGDPQPFLLPNATGFQGQGGNSLLLRVADPSEEPGLEKEPHEDELKRKLEILDPFGPSLPGTGPAPPIPFFRSNPPSSPAAPGAALPVAQAQPGSSNSAPTTSSAGPARVPQPTQLGGSAPRLVPPAAVSGSSQAPIRGPTASVPSARAIQGGPTDQLASPEAGGAPSGPASDKASRASSSRSWRRFEETHGSQQTSYRTKYRGKDVTARLDFALNENGIVDLKEYNWWRPSYQKPFIQRHVIEDFKEQIQKYQTLHPNVRYQFSEQPPPWAEQAIEDVGGTYFVKPHP